jgi:hypothetical protein
MLRVAEIVIRLVWEILRWLRLSVRSNRSIKAENLFLRRQLALYVERGVTPRRIDLGDADRADAAVTMLQLAGRFGGRSSQDVAALAPSGMEVVLAAEVAPRSTADSP